MEIEEIAAESAKMIVDLEASCERLQREKLLLQGEVRELKASEETKKAKCVKLKGKCAEMEEGFGVKQRKWREERENIREKYWAVRTEKCTLDIDLKAAKDEVERLKSLLEEKEVSIAWLLGKIKALERRNSKLASDVEAAEMRSRELEKARVSALLDVKRFLEEGDGTSGVVERGNVKIGEELVADSDALKEKEKEKGMGNGNSESSPMYLDCQKSSGASHNEPQKESLDRAAVQLKGHSGDTPSSKLFCNDIGTSGVTKRGNVKIGKELVVDSDAFKEKKQMKAMGNGNSKSSAMYMDCQKSSGASHNEPQKESLDRAAVQLKGHSGETSSSKLFCNDIQVSVATPAKSKDHNNSHIQVSVTTPAKLLDVKRFLKEGDGNSGVVERGNVKIGEELVTDSDVFKENKQKKAIRNGNSESSAMNLDCQKSSGASHSEPQKESLDRAAVQLKGHSGETSCSKLVCNDIQVSVATPAKSKDPNNSHIGKGSSTAESDDRIITRCLTKELENASHERLECTPLVTSQTVVGGTGTSIVPQKRNAEALGCSIEKQFGNKHYESGDSQSVAGKECARRVASQSIAGSPGSSIVPKRRKMEVLGYSVAKQISINQEIVGGKSGSKLKWDSATRMFIAFTADNELCMSSICALYRKHKALGQWKNCSSLIYEGFKPQHEARGLALGELLTNGDPEGVMKKSLAEFKQADPVGLDDCRLIARHHHKELFQIYKNKLDPLFLPDECI